MNNCLQLLFLSLNILFTSVISRLFTFVNMKITQQNYNDLLGLYSLFKNEDLRGRYITYSHIEKFVSSNDHRFPVEVIGRSFMDVPIHALTIGTGKIKVLAWSQMHGNETTTTKAIFDIINAFKKFPDHPALKNIKDNITFTIIPMLNPDGAKAYTRVNANNIDLNRDAHNLQEKESQVLRAEFELFKPHFCFNLHDQRTIFSAGKGPNPATISFLAPAMDENRKITPSRITAMKVISSIVSDIQNLLPEHIGRYDDAYNINCTGDTFQSIGIPTLLFEAGHYQEDYNRERTREFITAAILSGLKSIACGNWESKNVSEYFNIPENQKNYYDVILRSATVQGETVDVAIQFREKLNNEEIEFEPVIEKLGKSLPFYGHREIDLKGEEVKTQNLTELSENVIVHKLLLKNEVLIVNYHNY